MPSLFIINVQYAFHALTADMGVFVQFSEGRRAQGRKEDDASCRRHTHTKHGLWTCHGNNPDH